MKLPISAIVLMAVSLIFIIGGLTEEGVTASIRFYTGWMLMGLAFVIEAIRSRV